MAKKPVLVVIPAYNESGELGKVLKKLKKQVDADFLVIDDGSHDDTGKISEKLGFRVIRHVINLGLGASISTGFEIARREGYEIMITCDADGQHKPADLKKIIDEIKDGEMDVCIGIRTVNIENMPFIKRVGNIWLNFLTLIIFQVKSRDSQSGLRAFNRKAIESIRLKSIRYEVSSEILFEAKKNELKISEIPIEVIYTPHSLKQATGVLDGVKILWKMIMHKGGVR